MKIPTVSLTRSVKIPLVGLGTWDIRGAEGTKTIRLAYELGYRHLDTASVYENHKAIGKALKDLPREDMFLTSKIATKQIDVKKVEKSVEKACDLALKELGTDYIDLYLLHWPDRSLPLPEILSAIAGLIAKGKIRCMGVSNFAIGHLRDALKKKVPIVANQVEFHPYLYQKKLLDYSKKHGIKLIGYRPLGMGRGGLLQDPVIAKIGKRHEKSPAQVILRWFVQKKIPVICKAAKPSHLKANIDIFDFDLSDKELASIDGLNCDKRLCAAGWDDFNYV